MALNAVNNYLIKFSEDFQKRLITIAKIILFIVCAKIKERGTVL